MQQQQGGVMGLIFPIALFVLIFYFLIFRPQKKKQQQHDQMIASIGRGDTIVTAGGFFGKVSEILEDSYVIEIADGVKVRILKSSISIKRDGAGVSVKQADRPRKKKRRRREPGAETGAENAALEDGSLDDEAGVTPEENEALIEGAGDPAEALSVDSEQSPDSDETKDE